MRPSFVTTGERGGPPTSSFTRTGEEQGKEGTVGISGTRKKDGRSLGTTIPAWEKNWNVHQNLYWGRQSLKGTGGPSEKRRARTVDKLTKVTSRHFVRKKTTGGGVMTLKKPGSAGKDLRGEKNACKKGFGMGKGTSSLHHAAIEGTVSRRRGKLVQ